MIPIVTPREEIVGGIELEHTDLTQEKGQVAARVCIIVRCMIVSERILE